MSKKITGTDFHQLLEEIRQTEGLPENLSTEAHLWDEALKKEAFVMPDHLECEIRFQDGGTYNYRVPVLKVQSYSLENIEKKHLSVLTPFLPLRFRKAMVRDRNTGKIRFQITKEELTSFYQELILILDREVEAGQLTVKNRSILLSLLRKSMIRVFYQDEAMIKEVVEMTEPILELEIEEYIRASEESQELARKVTQELEQTSQELEQYKENSARDQELIASLRSQLEALQKKP